MIVALLSVFSIYHWIICAQGFRLAPRNSFFHIMAKRKHLATSSNDRAGPDGSTTLNSAFTERPDASQATCLTDGVRLASLHDNVIMPWVGFGTYRLGKGASCRAVVQALRNGYRAIDTAFIYGGETMELHVGQAIQVALDQSVLRDRKDVFVITKHWRAYHGYEKTMECLRLSLQRLNVQYIDLYLMHWPGPSYEKGQRKSEVENRWTGATVPADQMAATRAETWRAMEDACRQQQVRAIGVSNMTVQHLKKLKETATLWPPAVNQIELHPLNPQTELLEYCRNEGIVVQAYASLGGQDTGKDAWKQLLQDPSRPPVKKKDKLDLMSAGPVVDLANQLQVTPAQVLLRWALEQGCAIIPKTTSPTRLVENANLFGFALTPEQVQQLPRALMDRVRANNPDAEIESLTRLCWRSDPLRLLDFE